MNEPLFLTLDHVLRIHAFQVEEHGGSDRLLNLGALQSAVAMPRQSFGGNYVHEDYAAMAAAYLFHIVKNHAFEDGNKRTGVQAAIVFLDINGFRLDLTQDEVVMLGLDVAEDRMNKECAAAFFRAKLNEA